MTDHVPAIERLEADGSHEAFKVLQVIQQRAWALGDEQYGALAKEAMEHLASPAPKAEQPWVAELEGLRERVRIVLENTVDAELWGPHDDWVRVIPETLDAAADSILKIIEASRANPAPTETDHEGC